MTKQEAVKAWRKVMEYEDKFVEWMKSGDEKLGKELDENYSDEVDLNEYLLSLYDAGDAMANILEKEEN